MIVHVSSSRGNDANDGTSPLKAKRTVAAGRALISDRSDDELLLACGDEWDESLGHWMKSGRAEGAPLVIGSYGYGPRPLLRTGTFDGFYTGPGGGGPARVENVTLRGLHFHADDYTGVNECYGARLLQPGGGFLFDDCKFEGYGQNLSFQAYSNSGDPVRIQGITVRRCIVVDAFSKPGGMHSQGMYVENVDGLLVEDCLFDRNGSPDIFSHGIYIQNGCNAVKVRRTTIANSGSHGLQLRCGGIVSECLFYRNPIALLVGGGNTPDRGGVSVDVKASVVVEGKNIDGANPRGWAINLANVASGSVSGNVIAHNSGSQPSTLSLEGDVGVGVHDLRIAYNVVHDWGGDPFDQRGDVGGITYEGNEVDWEPSLYLDPTRLPPPGFLAAARSREAGEWLPNIAAPRVCRYVRDGFVRPR